MSEQSFAELINAESFRLNMGYFTFAQLSEVPTIFASYIEVNKVLGEAATKSNFAVSEEGIIASVRASIDNYLALCQAEIARREAIGILSKGKMHLIPPVISPEERLERLNMRTFLLEHGTPIIGHLSTSFETGSEGMWWVLIENGKVGHNAEQFIQKNDYLTVYDHQGAIVFDDIIECDTDTGWKPYHKDKPWGVGQQVANIYWVHWIQKDWLPDKWFELFSQNPPFRARLIPVRSSSSPSVQDN